MMFKDFVSAVLDVTIVKPLYEACTGEDLITGEDLTEFERNMKVVFAAIDAVTLGMALEANLASEMGVKELLKVAAIDFLSNTAATGVSYIGEALELPQSVTLILSFVAGISVSMAGTSIVFKDAKMNVIREVDIEDIPELENISVGKIAGEVDVGKPVAVEIEGDILHLTVENKNMTGMDWYDYFRETYGKDNVCWENCNPSEVAKAWQGSYPYVGVDSYTNTTLHYGDIIWMGEPFPTGYSTTTEAIADLGNDAQKVFGGLQVKPYYEKGMPFAEYRSRLTPYKVQGELNVAEGLALNNPPFGEGGLAQIFDPNFDYNYANGFLERLEERTIELTNTKVSLEDYFNMMDEIN